MAWTAEDAREEAEWEARQDAWEAEQQDTIDLSYELDEAEAEAYLEAAEAEQAFQEERAYFHSAR